MLSANGILKQNDYRVLFCHSNTYKGGDKMKYSILDFTPLEDGNYKISLSISATPE